jgi:hypothetical protein
MDQIRKLSEAGTQWTSADRSSASFHPADNGNAVGTVDAFQWAVIRLCHSEPASQHVTLTKQVTLLFCLLAAVSCASTHRDSTPNDAGLGGSAGSGGASEHDAQAGSLGAGGGSGGASEHDGQAGSLGTGGGGSDHSIVCPSERLHGPDDQVLPASDFDASTFGCYPDRVLAPVGWVAAANYPACPGTSDACTYSPAHLPCGSCSTTDTVCGMGVYAACSCGGGTYLDAYWDDWACKCVNGKWDCRIIAPSGSSCFLECDAGLPE